MQRPLSSNDRRPLSAFDRRATPNTDQQMSEAAKKITKVYE